MTTMIPVEEQFKCYPPKTETRILNHSINNDAALNYAVTWKEAIEAIRTAEQQYLEAIVGCLKNKTYSNKIISILHNVKQRAFCLIDKQGQLKEDDFQDLIDEIQTIRMLVNQQIIFKELEQEAIE